MTSGDASVPALSGPRRYPLFANLQWMAYSKDPPSRGLSRVLRPAFNPGAPDGRVGAPSQSLDLFRVLCDFGVVPAGTLPGHRKLEDPNGPVLRCPNRGTLKRRYRLGFD